MSAKFVVIHLIVACVIRGNNPLVLCCSESQCCSAGTNQQICNSHVNSPTGSIKCHCHQKKMMSANCKKLCFVVTACDFLWTCMSCTDSFPHTYIINVMCVNMFAVRTDAVTFVMFYRRYQFHTPLV